MPHGTNTTLDVLGALAVVLVATRLAGRLACRAGQPAVVGELAAGLLLGPTVLGGLVPGGSELLFPPDVRPLLTVIGALGLTFYLFLTGAETAVGTAGRRELGSALLIAACGIVVPFGSGMLLGLWAADRIAGPAASPWLLALFLGGALSVTALPVLARILTEHRLVGTRFGDRVLLAAAVDDLVAWALLAVVVALAGATGSPQAVGTLIAMAVFAVAMPTLGRAALRPLARRVEAAGELTPGTGTVVLLLVLGAAWVGELIGVHAAFGGFLAGLALPRSPVLRRGVRDRLLGLNALLLLPVFFVTTGLAVDLRALGSGLLWPLVWILVTAIVGKYLGAGAAMLLRGHSGRAASSVGGLMNARGSVLVIFAQVGLAHHVINGVALSVLVLVAIVTTALATPIHRWSAPHTEGPDGGNAPTRGPTPPAAAGHAPAHDPARHPSAQRAGDAAGLEEGARR